MGNTLQIRRGSGAPTYTDFAQYELAYDYTNDVLYIRDGNAMVPLNTANAVDTSGSPVANQYARFTDNNTIEGRSYSAVRNDLGLNIGSDVQAYDTLLQDIADLSLSNPTQDGYVLAYNDASSTLELVEQSGGVSFNGSTANGLLTYGNSTTADVESNLTFDGDFKVTGTGGSTFETVGFDGSNGYLLLSGTASQRMEFRNTTTNANGWIGIPSWNTDAFYAYLPTASGNELAYIYESSRHNLYNDVALQATKKLYLDGGSDTYISETSADNLKFYVGGVNLLSMIEGGTNVVKVGDGTYLGVGDSTDLYMYHTDGNSFINNGTGRFTIRNTALDQDIRFSVNDGGVTSNILTLNAASSRVGIGTTAPSYSLHVIGTGQFTDDVRVGDDLVFNANANYIYQRDSASTLTRVLGINASNTTYIGPIDAYAGGSILYGTSSNVVDQIFYTSGTEKLRIKATTGNVGIGTNSPGYKLDVNGTSGLRDNVTIFDDKTLYVGNDLTNGLRIFHLSSNNNNYIRSNGGALNLQTIAAQPMYFITNNTTAMTIDSSQNVGIGYTSPAEKLSVNGSILIPNNTHFKAYNSAGTPVPVFRFNSSNQVEIVNGNSSNGDIILADATTTNMIIKGDTGNVGIGDTNPPNKLSVKGSSTDLLYLEGDGITSTSIIASDTGGSVRTRSAGGAWQLYTGGSANSSGASFATFAMEVDENQRVGIGTGSPSNKLEAYGTDAGLVVHYQGNSRGGIHALSTQRIALATTSSADDLVFGYGGSPVTSAGFVERMRIDNGTGNVGIGTTSPSAELDVKSQINVTNSNNNSLVGLKGTRFGYSDTYRVVQVGNTSGNESVSIGYDPSGNSSGSFTGDGREIIFRNGAEFITPNSANNGFHNDILVLKDGNVGIGTNSPASKLHIDDSTNYNMEIRRTSLNGIKLEAGSGSPLTSKIKVAYNDFSYIDAITIVNQTAGAYTQGNVGIGTNSPGALLDVGGTIKLTSSGVLQWGNSANYGNLTWDGDSAIVQGQSGRDLDLRSGSSRNILFKIGSSESVRIASNGRLIVGSNYTTNASTQLVVSSSGANGLLLNNDNSNAANSGRIFFEGTTTSAIFQEGSDLSFRTTATTGSGSGTERFRINTDGVQVHSGALGVNVTMSTTDGRIDAGNDVVAFSTSDKRLKENIKPLDSALDKVLKINGVEFDWKPLNEEEKKTIHGNEGHDVGVIAQEIEEVLPEVVATRDSGYKAVKYEKMIPLLIEAIKEQQQQINELKEKLNG